MASEAFNCSRRHRQHECSATAPDRRKWLKPLMEGEIRSAFLMTSPRSHRRRDQHPCRSRCAQEYVVSGRKWWSSGAGDPRCKLAIVMGKSDPQAATHQQQSMILVPMDADGVKVVRHLPVFGYDDAPHGHMEVELDEVRVPASNILLGEGRGFEIAQGRLGPGRIHHCMRMIGVSEEALGAMTRRLQSRTAFGKTLAEQSVWEERIADARIDIEMTRLLCLKAADMMDRVGKSARRDSMIRFPPPPR